MDQLPRPAEDRDDGQDRRRDLDAEFAALMGDVDIPDDLSAEDLGAVQEAGSEPGRHFIAGRRFARSRALLDSNTEIFPKFDGRCNIFYAPIGRSIVQYDAPQVGDHQQIVGAYRPFTGRGL